MYAYLAVFSDQSYRVSVALSKRVTEYDKSLGAARELPKTVMYLTEYISVLAKHFLISLRKYEGKKFMSFFTAACGELALSSSFCR